MREITLSNGSKVKVNPLKGKDVREIDAMQRNPDAVSIDTVFETLVRSGFTPEALDDMPFPDILALNKAVIAETYGIEEEEKN